MINCPICHKSFAPKHCRHKYCSEKCKEVAKKRKQRLKLQDEGKCPQCGGEMDHPVGKNRDRVSYCSRCREYFAKNHQRRVENGND